MELEETSFSSSLKHWSRVLGIGSYDIRSFVAIFSSCGAAHSLLSSYTTLWQPQCYHVVLQSHTCAWTKYIEFDIYFIREKVVAQQLLIQYVLAHAQVNDVLTKTISTIFLFFTQTQGALFDSIINLWGSISDVCEMK